MYTAEAQKRLHDQTTIMFQILSHLISTFVITERNFEEKFFLYNDYVKALLHQFNTS